MSRGGWRCGALALMVGCWGGAAGVLALQRGAGNRAVTRRFARIGRPSLVDFEEHVYAAKPLAKPPPPLKTR